MLVEAVSTSVRASCVTSLRPGRRLLRGGCFVIDDVVRAGLVFEDSGQIVSGEEIDYVADANWNLLNLFQRVGHRSDIELKAQIYVVPCLGGKIWDRMPEIESADLYGLFAIKGVAGV